MQSIGDMLYYIISEAIMFNIGDYIVYAGEGVCRVDAIGPVSIAYIDQRKTYYTLAPVYHTGLIYAPADSSARMRPMLTAEEARSLIYSIPDMPTNYELPSNPKQIVVEYKNYLETYDCENLLHLIRILYAKREEAAIVGRGYGQTDDRYFKRAKDLLYGELALALNIPVDRVESTITDTLKQLADD